MDVKLDFNSLNFFFVFFWGKDTHSIFIDYFQKGSDTVSKCHILKMQIDDESFFCYVSNENIYTMTN